jgi:signal transduction histidine kinase
MSVAAHDLRNPIAVVRASAQMAQRLISRGDLDGAQHRLKAIVEQTDRLTEVLETFLDAARIDANVVQLRPELLDVRELVEAAVARTRAVVGEHALREIAMDLPEGCKGWWDRARTVRALRALLTNAVLYGDQAAPVVVVATPVGERLVITVSGGGSGPDGEESSHLFERFYRGPSAAESGQSGSGLGLYTARGNARMQGGDVRRSAGDRFELELPFEPVGVTPR